MLNQITVIFLICTVTAQGFVYHVVENVQKAMCISDNENAVAPVFDLDSPYLLEQSKSVMAYTDSWDLWNTKGLKLIPDQSYFWSFFNPEWHNYPQIVSNKGTGYQRLTDLTNNILAKGNIYISILADSASFLLTESEGWQGKPAVIVEFDHMNEATNARELRLLTCDEFDDLKGNCSVIKAKNIDLLERGKKWIHFRFIVNTYENTLNIIKYGRDGEIRLMDILDKKLRRLTTRYTAVKSLRKAGLFKIHQHSLCQPNQTKDENYLSRNFEIKKKEGHRVTVRIRWEETSRRGLMQIENRRYGKEEVIIRTIKHDEWNTEWNIHLKKGLYTFSVHNISGKISQIKLWFGKEIQAIFGRGLIGCQILLDDKDGTSDKKIIKSKQPASFEYDWIYLVIMFAMNLTLLTVIVVFCKAPQRDHCKTIMQEPQSHVVVFSECLRAEAMEVSNIEDHPYQELNPSPYSKIIYPK